MPKLLKKLETAIRHPVLFPYYLVPRRLLPDGIFIKAQFLLKTRNSLNLKKTKTFNEKIQWLKLYDRKPEYVQMADKYAVREYIAQKIGEKYLVPLVGGPWKNFDEIDFEKLPDRFVLKCTHNSGGIVICKDKHLLNTMAVRKKIETCLKRNYYYHCREWVYKDIRPRIIAEQFMADESNKELKDYKVFCFNGKPKIIQVDFDRFTEHKRNCYSTNWEYQPFSLEYPAYPGISIPKPKSLDLMLDMARTLSSGTIHLRVDFYIIDEKIYFGELTFYHGAGYEKFEPPEWNTILGDWIQLPLTKKC